MSIEKVKTTVHITKEAFDLMSLYVSPRKTGEFISNLITVHHYQNVGTAEMTLSGVSLRLRRLADILQEMQEKNEQAHRDDHS